MIFPIGDTQVKGGHYPYVSYFFIFLNIAIFILQTTTQGSLICEGAVIPESIMRGQDQYTLLSSLFLHGSLVHLLGNLLFIWVFADNIEAKIGSIRFTIFYLVGGVVATFAHIYFGSKALAVSDCCIPCSADFLACNSNVKACPNFIPSLGASGAISAVIGAYMVMFPNSQIKVLVIFLFRSIYTSAWFFLGLWFVTQLVSGFFSHSHLPIAGLDGVAWWAHIGGFIFGILCGFIFRSVYDFKEDLEE